MLAKKYLSIFIAVIILATIEPWVIYFITYNWLSLLIVILWELSSLFVFCIKATSCVYLKDEMLIKKNIFYCKKISVNKNTKIMNAMLGIKIGTNKQKFIFR